MFKNPIKKYQTGGIVTPQQQQQIAQLFEAASKNTGIDIETLMNAANQMPDENSMNQYVNAISKAAKGDQEAISSIQEMFSQQAVMQKLGGKIQSFICKHAKGGKVGSDCGCKKEDGGTVEKHQQSNGKGRGTITATKEGFTVGPKYYNTNPDGSTQSRQYATNAAGNAVEQTITDRSQVRDRGMLPVRDTLNRIGIMQHNGYFMADNEATEDIYGAHPYFQNIGWNKVRRWTPDYENGGTVEMAANGERLSKREALAKAREAHGYDASQARIAYLNAKNALRQQGLRGRALRDAAREMISRGNSRSEIEAIAPGNAMNNQVQTVGMPAMDLTRRPNNYDALSFSNAFRAARNINGDNSIFSWRGNKYTTNLGSSAGNNSVSLPGLAPVQLENTEIEIPEYAPLPIDSISTNTASILYPGLEDIQNPNGTVSSKWPVGSWLQNQDGYKMTFRSFTPRDKQSRVLTVTSPSLYKPGMDFLSYKNGGTIQKAQEGTSLIDFYKNKLNNDFFE